jgi:hypothetical protein
MKKTDDITLVSPCGGYCGDCPAYKVKDDPSLKEVLVKKFSWNGVPCQGCRPLKGRCQFVNGTCETYACINKRGHDFCFECAEFPCEKFNPAADKADVLPHNIKLFALCYIKQHGVDKWKEKTPEVKQRYFRGKMVIGKGPQLE